MSADPLARYYSERAPEYDRVYAKPERQADLAALRERVERWATGRRVLELACGTGYWTAVMARSATAILATDVNESVLDLARARPDPRGIVTIRRGDALAPGRIAGDFDAIFAGFWLSHVARDAMPGFVTALGERLGSGGAVLLVDNRFVEGSSTPLSRRDARGNTFQRRPLDDGSTHEILKNFPSVGELDALLAPRAASREIGELRHYWTASWIVA